MSDRPKIVCLVGSTRFRREFEHAFYSEEHAGCICLTVPCFKDDPCCKTPAHWAVLDALHRHKIDMADEVVVVAPGGYIGDSTRAEIDYATAKGKPVRWTSAAVRVDGNGRLPTVPPLSLSWSGEPMRALYNSLDEEGQR